jgi:hypothetical protein
LTDIPLGTAIHNIELIPNKGGQLVRAGGTSARILAKEGDYVTLRLPSKEIRLLRKECFATIGEVSNNDAFLVQSGKAGRTRWLGKRPTVRGSVMNPCDHPHGGGEGRAPIGRTRPLTPWGKPALGMKTRKRDLDDMLKFNPKILEFHFSDSDLNLELEKNWRVADLIELGAVMVHDAIDRKESCGGHFRGEHQTEKGEAQRNDSEWSFVYVW